MVMTISYSLLPNTIEQSDSEVSTSALKSNIDPKDIWMPEFDEKKSHRTPSKETIPIIVKPLKSSRRRRSIKKTMRTLRIKYWPRTEDCQQRKWDHMEKMDATEKSREVYILNTVLRNKAITLEPNMFPYNTPSNIEHWILWSRLELTSKQVEDYVDRWIKNERADVRRWNFDDNNERSINLFHVHVYLDTNNM